MIEVFLVRHGETDINKTGRASGAGLDAPLNDKGIQQACILRDSIDLSGFAKVYASPMKRAFKTAEIVNNSRQELVTDARLKEIDYGDWDGVSKAKLQREHPNVFDENGYFANNYSDYCTGESYAHLEQRAASFWQDLIKNSAADQKVMVACHGTILRAIVKNVLHISDIEQVVLPDNTGVIKLAVSDKTHKVYMKYYNRVAPTNFDE